MNEDLLFMIDEQSDENPEYQEEMIDSKDYIIFSTDDLQFGINVNNVVEIITSYATTYLPMLPEYIRGIINLRGSMVPIVDIRLRLGKMSKEDCNVIVLEIDGTQIGILVDSVEQLINIPDRDILPMPAHSVQKLVSGMCSLPDGSGTMLVFDCEQLISHEY